MQNTTNDNLARMRVQISKDEKGLWKFELGLTVSLPRKKPKPSPKNIVFLLDNSISMKEDKRLDHLKSAVSNLLDKLTDVDTFSIVTFNTNATVCVEGEPACIANIQKAQSEIKDIKAIDRTDFKKAFTAINSSKIIPQESNTIVIFFTDGFDNNNCTAQSLADLFHNKKLPRVIPIGVFDSANSANRFLDTLAALSHHEGKAIYIKDNNPNTYINAFDNAFQEATKPSSPKTAQLEVTIHAENQANSTTLHTTRTLNDLHDDGSSETSTVLYFDSPTPPQSLELTVNCDNISLQAPKQLMAAECNQLKQSQTLTINISHFTSTALKCHSPIPQPNTTAEFPNLEQSRTVNANIPAFKGKDNRRYSWILALLSMTIGTIVLASVALFMLSAPPINLWLWPPLATCALASLVGLSLLTSGVVALARKTLVPPIKLSAGDEDEKERIHVEQPRFFAMQPRAKMLASINIAAGGAAIGYVASTTAAAANAVVATGLSPALFALGCAAAGAIALLLLAYGCMLVYKAPLQPTPQTLRVT